MSITCSSPEEKKVLAYCECCVKPLYKGDKVIRDKIVDGILTYIDYYCSHKCFDRDIPVEIVTL